MNSPDSHAAQAVNEARAHSPKGVLLATLERLLDVDYMADAKVIGPSAEAECAIEVLHQVRPMQDRLDLAWVGAAIAHMFLKHVWLQSVRVEISAEAQYDDAGGCYLSHSLRFQDVVPAPNVRFPEAVSGESGAFDGDAAAELLAEEHADDAYDFAAPFLYPTTSGNDTLQLSRDTLAPLLTGGAAVSGLDVARLLWPDHETVRRIATRVAS